ncbi:hypothetical protein [Curtobacterium sp. L1-20]|uniref:hypothetical protein n=1 Tax=Curtobacterium sp. L1-20 TaxID=3138181 RepID=UPI003B51FE10
MDELEKYMSGQDCPDEFRLVVSLRVSVTDWEKLRDRRIAMQTDEDGAQTLSIPPTKFWSNAASLISDRIWADDISGEEGVRILGSSVIPRFPKDNGTYGEIVLPEL